MNRHRLILLCISVSLVASLAACDDPFIFGTYEPFRTEAQRIGDLAERLEADTRMLSVDRGLGRPGWQMAQDVCAQRFADLGFDVGLQQYSTGVNVIGTLPGTQEPDKLVLIGAHYDSVDDCPGADDNASAMAGTFEAASVLSANGPHDRTLVVACWDEEERGLVGSIAYVAGAKEEGREFVTTYAMEMIGYYSEEPGSQEVPQGFDVLFPEQTEALLARENRGEPPNQRHAAPY